LGAVFPAAAAVVLAVEGAVSGKIDIIRWNLCSSMPVYLVQTSEGGEWIMISRKWMSIAVLIAALFLIISVSGCKPGPLATELEEEKVYKTEGILVGQIDNHSVEIEVGGIPRAFRLAEGLVITDLADGSRVEITYLEADTDEAENGGDRRPLLLSIEAVDLPPEVIDLYGIYNGQIDSHSVEIEIAGEAQVFALDGGLKVDHLDSGTEVFITYRQEGQRQLLLSIEPVTGPVGDGNELLVGEGLLIGLIDAQSVEIMINRAFVLDQGISVEGIDDGSLVVFKFKETGLRAVIESIKAVNQPLEGELMHGTLVGQIDGQSIEIEYFQAFALGRGVSVEGIADGTEVVFTYIEGDHRPVLTSIKAR
jgi:hypothetical protein